MHSTSIVVLILFSLACNVFSLRYSPRARIQSLKAVPTMEYIPEGLSKAQWAALKEKEKNKKVGKFDGTSGMQFRSRSFADFQKGREAGTLTYNMVFRLFCLIFKAVIYTIALW